MKKNRLQIFPPELFQGLKVILMVTFGGVALFGGLYALPGITAVVVMVTSVILLILARRFFE